MKTVRIDVKMTIIMSDLALPLSFQWNRAGRVKASGQQVAAATTSTKRVILV